MLCEFLSQEKGNPCPITQRWWTASADYRALHCFSSPEGAESVGGDEQALPWALVHTTITTAIILDVRGLPQASGTGCII